MRLRDCLHRHFGLVALFWLGALASFDGAAGQDVQTDGHHEQRFRHQFPAMGVQFQVVLYCDNVSLATSLFEKCEQRAQSLNQVFSDYIDDSEAAQLSSAETNIRLKVSRDLWTVLNTSRQISQETGGAFDVTIGPLSHLWRTARKTHRVPDAATLTQAKEAVGWQKFELDQPSIVVLRAEHLQFDFGGIAKGYAADECLNLVQQAGIKSVLVDAGGDIALGNAPPGRPAGWVVAISAGAYDSPPDSLPLHKLVLKNCGVATSGDSEQHLDAGRIRYSHIVDPRTGQAMTTRSNVTVIASTATTADALASALSVLTPDEGIQLVDRQADESALVVLDADQPHLRKVFRSSRFPEFVGSPQK